jgi:ABC-2 type transport system permease protein
MTALADASTMIWRILVRLRRYPGLTISVLVSPLIFLVLFGWVLRDAFAANLRAMGMEGSYLQFLTPTIIVMTVASAATTTAIGVSTDLTRGIVARFRTMAITRSAYLIGHAVGPMALNLVAVLLMTGVATAMGFRTDTSAPLVILTVLLLVLLTATVTWLGVLIGLTSSSPETASNWPLLIILLPFLGSGFIPTASLPAGTRWFAEHQPFTLTIDAVRALLLEDRVIGSYWGAVAWMVAITAAAAVISIRKFARV